MRHNKTLREPSWKSLTPHQCLLQFVCRQGRLQLRHHTAADVTAEDKCADEEAAKTPAMLLRMDSCFCATARVDVLAGFADFARTELPQRLHQTLITATQKDQLIGHFSRDSTAIAARERFAEASAKPRAEKKGKTSAQAKSPKKAKATERGTLIQRQRHINCREWWLACCGNAPLA